MMMGSMMSSDDSPLPSSAVGSEGGSGDASTGGGGAAGGFEAKLRVGASKDMTGRPKVAAMAVALLKRVMTLSLISENVTEASSRRTSPVTMMLPATTVSVMCSAVMLGWL